jgi:glycosyltransferase involved in cell wall biosynthesis
MPTVLVVGSSEPRKNHLAVLYAAEVLWRRGHRFGLTFIGGRAWGSDRFARRAAELANAGRPIDIATGVSDAQLWAAYRVSRFTVFPSLAEGFGLPAAESLACGTPTITSDFGSMKEIGRDGGALLVDPRDDEQIVDAMERLLTDDALLDRLRCEARRRPVRTWDMYAAETWDRLVTMGR